MKPDGGTPGTHSERRHGPKNEVTNYEFGEARNKQQNKQNPKKYH